MTVRGPNVTVSQGTTSRTSGPTRRETPVVTLDPWRVRRRCPCPIQCRPHYEFYELWTLTTHLIL